MYRYGTDNDAIVRLAHFKVSRLARETAISRLCTERVSLTFNLCDVPDAAPPFCRTEASHL